MSNGFRPVFTTTHPITGGLTRIERARGFLEAAVLSEQWVREMGQRALLLEAHHTTNPSLTQERAMGGILPPFWPKTTCKLLILRRRS